MRSSLRLSFRSGRRGRRRRRAHGAHVEAALVELVAVLLRALFVLDAALRREGLARGEHAAHVHGFVGAQHFLADGIQLRVLRLALRERGALQRGLTGQALTFGFGGARHLQQVVVGAAVLRDLRTRLLARGLGLLAQLRIAGAGLTACMALGRELGLAGGQFLLQRLELGCGGCRTGCRGRLARGLAGLDRGQLVLRLLQLRGGGAQLRAQPLLHARALRWLGMRHAGRGGQRGEGQHREDRSGHGALLLWLRNAH